MPRPTNRVPTERIVMSGTPKLVRYLDDLVDEEGYGNSRAEVARTLVWRMIEDLLAKGVLEQKRGRSQ